jgi:PBP1b-binding outer membrane lipoprotein LpoB
MIKKTALTGLIALALLAAACSKQAPPTAAQDDEEGVTTSAPAPAPQPEPSTDHAGQAAGMMSLLSSAPECQSYRDELQAIADAPAGTKPAREPSLVVAAAHDAGCSKKARGE